MWLSTVQITQNQTIGKIIKKLNGKRWQETAAD